MPPGLGNLGHIVVLLIQMIFAWGGPEGRHNIFNMNSSPLGGWSRPSLY